MDYKFIQRGSKLFDSTKSFVEANFVEVSFVEANLDRIGTLYHLYSEEEIADAKLHELADIVQAMWDNLPQPTQVKVAEQLGWTKT